MKTHWRKSDNPNYLGAYSLMDGETKELTATIEKIVTEEVKTDRGAEPCRVMYIKGQKPMILNTTNSKAIEKALATPYVEDWAGKRITIYVAKIKAFGEEMDALRIKPIKPEKEELTPDHTKWAGAVQGIEAGTVTIEQIKKYYRISSQNEKLLCNDSK